MQIGVSSDFVNEVFFKMFLNELSYFTQIDLQLENLDFEILDSEKLVNKIAYFEIFSKITFLCLNHLHIKFSTNHGILNQQSSQRNQKIA